jgi:signal transduction histidine kinase/ActR/RegA family two-component response regulator
MKLQHKAWALVLGCVGVLTLATVWQSGRYISATFSDLERARAEVEVERAKRLLDQQMDALSATLKDYAYWADTVAYLEGRNPGFFEENFTTDSLATLRVSGVLVMDMAATARQGAMFNDDDSIEPLRHAHTRLLTSLAETVLKDPSGDRVVTSYFPLDGQLFLIAVAAVRSGAESGTPPRGALAMIRRFDQRELTSFSAVLMRPVRLSFEDADRSRQGLHLEFINDARAEGHVMILDHLDRPAAGLVLGLDRSLHQEGESLARAAGLAAALGGLLMGALLVLLLDRFLLRRLQGLHQDLHDITDQGLSGEGRVRVQGRDEVSELGEGINRLLTRVRDDVAAQQEARDRQEALQLQLMQSQKTEALGRFTSGIAHDFNNSLAAIGGWVRLADEDLDPQHSSHESLQQALKATRYANGLMRQLLAFSRQSVPKLELLQVCRLIEESRSLLASGLLRECELVVDCPPQVVWAMADQTQMQQVLVNLIMNAVDAMGGRGTIELAVERVVLPSPDPGSGLRAAGTLPAGAYIRFAVKDQGPGIPEEHVSRVFDPFFTTKGVGKGTGLGLSVAQGIMARHGGSIGFTTAPGAGTTFHLHLPEALPPVAEAPDQGNEGKSGARQLLFAEDDPSVRHAWATLLERQGWAVTTARDGEEAWTLFQSGPLRFDLVVTDLAMPRLDGASLAKRIRATRMPPPIILMSGNVSAEDAELLMRTDFVAVLHKPVEVDRLNRAMLAAVGQSEEPATSVECPSGQDTVSV